MLKIPEGLVNNNGRYKILTLNGYEDFRGIRKTKKNKVVHISCLDGTSTSVSQNHIFCLWNNKLIFAGDLIVGSALIGKDYKLHYVTSISTEEKETDFFDVVDSGKDKLYFGDNLLSHNCEFLGSSSTLISGRFLKTMVVLNPIHSQHGLDVYEDPKTDVDVESGTHTPHAYVICSDTARGQRLDYSALVVIDVTNSPNKIVAKYRSNVVPPNLFADQIIPIARRYNNAYILMELDGPGSQVAEDLHHIHEYENILMVASRGRGGQILATGFGTAGKNVQRGVKMSTPVRRNGCSVLKTLLETKRLVTFDVDVKSELSTFSLKGDKYQAEEGKNDDLVMCLVVFSWLTGQKHFRDLMEAKIRQSLQLEYAPQFDHDLTPFGWITDGLDKKETIVAGGDTWISSQNSIWETFAEQEMNRAKIDPDQLRRLEDFGWA